MVETTIHKYVLELDCAPGLPRPGDLLPGVLKGTKLKLDRPSSMFFGNWAWVIPAEQEALYEKNRNKIAKRIKALYEVGAIRYGAW